MPDSMPWLFLCAWVAFCAQGESGVEGDVHSIVPPSDVSPSEEVDLWDGWGWVDFEEGHCSQSLDVDALAEAQLIVLLRRMERLPCHRANPFAVPGVQRPWAQRPVSCDRRGNAQLRYSSSPLWTPSGREAVVVLGWVQYSQPARPITTARQAPMVPRRARRTATPRFRHPPTCGADAVTGTPPSLLTSLSLSSAPNPLASLSFKMTS